MSESPQELHKFYKDQSDFIHPIIGKDESTSEINVRGISAIRDRVSLLNLGGMKVSLEGGGIDAQPSDNDCVLIICNGFITAEPNTNPLAFAQTFVLAPQEGNKRSFFVRNSVFRLVSGGVVPRNVTHPSTPPVAVAAAAPEPVVSPKAIPVVLKEASQVVTESVSTVAIAPPGMDSSEKTANPMQATQPSPADVPKENSKRASSSTPAAAEKEDAAPAPVAPIEPVEKKPFSYASAVTIRGAPTAVAAPPAQKVSNSGGPGWSVAPTRKAEKPTEKTQEESSKETKELSKSSLDASQQGGKKELGPSLYLNKLNPDTTKEDILKVFSAYGKVGKIDLNSRGFAFVEYDNRKSVLDALTAHKENEAKHKLRGKLIEIQEKQGSKGNNGKGKSTQQANGKKKEKVAPAAVEAS